MVRPLVHFFLIGGLLFVGKKAVEASVPERPEIIVNVPASADESETEREIRNQILLNEAKRYGWYRTDPIVFTHLVRNMRFIEPQSTEDDITLFGRALALNMQEHDPVVRARLLYRAREALAHVPKDRMPSREELESHRVSHRDRFEREGKVRFEHVFLSGTKRGDDLASDAVAMRAKLQERGDEPPEGLGDPLPGLRSVQSKTVSEIAAGFGEDLADVVDQAVIGAWRGPVRTVYGLHFVRVLEKEPSSLPPLALIEAQVRADRLAEIKEALRKERMAALRKAYVVRVERAR
jgi:hypothetical protein